MNRTLLCCAVQHRLVDGDRQWKRLGKKDRIEPKLHLSKRVEQTLRVLQQKNKEKLSKGEKAISRGRYQGSKPIT